MSVCRSMSRSQLLSRAGLLTLLILLLTAPSFAGIAPPPDDDDDKYDIVIDDDDGKKRGKKGMRGGALFQSFSKFDLDENEVVPFLGRLRGDVIDRIRDKVGDRHKGDDRRERIAKRRERLKNLLAGLLEKLRDRKHDDRDRKGKRRHRRGGKKGGHGHGHKGGKGGYYPKPKPPVVPEPSTAVLMGLGLAGLGHASRRAGR